MYMLVWVPSERWKGRGEIREDRAHHTSWFMSVCGLYITGSVAHLVEP